ncbi:enoyl-CoA hydratase-related protein [Sphingobium algorifonticola]|uniref:2-(1,2-epoxy-1,2-dihydrophenyl)acetyl-CoA isomerase n=1 Tax=Sphingobium algorifonticola TaxID=2008318 RepID=A0A437J6J4_9SPHN|nr:enoyl-CoA hydratase-related protein [Sphingobium algorifonticola]RVT40802.1 2-(1,2-epoxy-1,2-dihydrophenyl)acetyl-CoA isomerase [Sphingobium algorifonticola]
MTYQTILTSVSDGVGILSLNRPERLNALTPQMFYEIADAIEAFPGQGARAILIKAEGKGFCSGTDLQAEGGLPDDVGEILEKDYNPCMERYVASTLPMVAQVHGACAGIGASLALACDFVVAAQSAYFLQAFVNIGLVPDGGATWTLPRLIGKARATELMMLGERLPAAKAADWGLIYKAVEDAALADEAMALATRLAAMPTVALGLIRKGIAETQTSSFSQGLALERAHQREAGRSADFKEGVQAFLAKRPAKFEGK